MLEIDFDYDGKDKVEGEEAIGVRHRVLIAPLDAPKPKEKKNKGAQSTLDHVGVYVMGPKYFDIFKCWHIYWYFFNSK